MASVTWTPKARDDLQATYLYIRRDSRRMAEAFVLRVEAAVDRLATFPESGRMAPEFRRPDIRELIRAESPRLLPDPVGRRRGAQHSSWRTEHRRNGRAPEGGRLIRTRHEASGPSRSGRSRTLEEVGEEFAVTRERTLHHPSRSKKLSGDAYPQ